MQRIALKVINKALNVFYCNIQGQNDKRKTKAKETQKHRFNINGIQI